MNCPDEYKTKDRREWHLDKTISITHIFSTIAAISTLVVLGSVFNTRLTLVEQAITNQQIVEAKADSASREFRQEIRDALKVTGEKLDRMIDRMPRK